MRNRTVSTFVVIAASVLNVLPASAADQRQNKTQLPEGTIQVMPSEIVWKDAPPTMPPGTQSAVLEGSPKETGIFTLRLKLPPNSRLATHWHPRPERVTVLEGALFVGFGETPNPAIGTRFGPGSFYINPANSHHYVWSEADGATVQITGEGPWEIKFVEAVKP